MNKKKKYLRPWGLDVKKIFTSRGKGVQGKKKKNDKKRNKKNKDLDIGFACVEE